MTAAGELLRDLIRREGPLAFSCFMQTALYHPKCGYYRTPRDPFGKQGDFFTAEQVQPVFGILMAALVRRLHAAMGSPADFTVVELGAGREEMAEAFGEWRYVPVDVGRGELPPSLCGVVFCNEFFDALPVDVALFTGGVFRQQRVACERDAFQWTRGPEVAEPVRAYLERWFPVPEEGRVYEVSLTALEWMGRIAAALECGYLLTIDYGYTRAESVRFPRGTLMAYRRHTAREDVLTAPGERDITAHVNFTALEEHGAERGLARESFTTLARTLLDAGEADQFASALGGGTCGEAEALRRRLQLKTLLFGMGETFRTLLQKKGRK